MPEFGNRSSNSSRPKRRLWHFDGRKTDWVLDVRRNAGSSGENPPSYIQIGVTHAEIEARANRPDPVLCRGRVVKWLIALAIFWIVFYFAEL